MPVPTTARTLASLAAVAVLAGGLTACGSDDDGSDAAPADRASETAGRPTPGVPGSTVTPDAPDASSAPATPGADPEEPEGPTECRAGDVAVTYEPGDNAAGTRYGSLVVTNTSEIWCQIEGFGGLSYVGGGDGEQVGAPADRDTSGQAPKPEVLTIEPGEQATALVSEAAAGSYPADECRPTEVDGFRVYLPDETRSVFVAHPTTACADDAVHLLAHQAYTQA
ncbi:DUF4232 domain-containing protein [Nocardioides sp. C4-1]|uniref:DUF4232 domain-containing protein n=1 Tax=Nocardioides sp. C4-1 TaxID=3151851 RepID=UPI0032645DBA